MTLATVQRAPLCLHAHNSGDGTDPHRAMLAANTAAVVGWPVSRLTKSVWLGVHRCQFSRAESGLQLLGPETFYNAVARGLVPVAVVLAMESLEPADERLFDQDGDGVPCDPDDLRRQAERARHAGLAYDSNPTDENARIWQRETNQLHKMHVGRRRMLEGGQA